MRFDGKLKSWNDERGFGFIEPELGGQEVFVHIKSFPHGTGRPGVGLPLSFEVEQDLRGKKRAKQVEFIRTPGHKSTNSRADMPAPWTFVRVMAIPVFIGVYAAVSMAWGVKPLLMLWVVLWYVVVSTVAFFAYALDKSTAKKRPCAVPRNLHSIFLHLQAVGQVHCWRNNCFDTSHRRKHSLKPFG